MKSSRFNGNAKLLYFTNFFRFSLLVMGILTYSKLAVKAKLMWEQLRDDLLQTNGYIFIIISCHFIKDKGTQEVPFKSNVKP